MKKAWRTGEGKVRHIFESHLRVPRALPLVLHRDGHFFSMLRSGSCASSALLRNLAGSRSHGDHRGLFFLVSVCVLIGDGRPREETINCSFPFFKSCKPGYRQDASSAHTSRFPLRRYQRPGSCKEGILKETRAIIL